MMKNKWLFGGGVLFLALVAVSVFLLLKPVSTTKSPDTSGISIEQNEQGLLVKGSVKSGTIDTVTISVKDPKQLNLPPIGWGNQFGDTVLSSADDCTKENEGGFKVENIKNCQTWYQKQLSFREEFKNLFVRTWVLSKDKVQETSTTEALRTFPSYVQKELEVLSVSTTSKPTITFEPDSHFEAQIHWVDLPPISSLEISSLQFEVHIAGSIENATSTQVVNLSKRREYSLTACQYPLSTMADWNNPGFSEFAQPFILPGADENLFQVLVMDNQIDGYQYDPGASSTSPTIYSVPYFQKKAADGGFLCGPQLTYMKGTTRIESSDFVNEATLDSKMISDHELLVKNGPFTWYSYYGSGQCGACTRGSFNMDYFNLKEATSTMAYYFDTVFDSNDADFLISKDWKTITEFIFQPVYSENASLDSYDSSLNKWQRTDYVFNPKTKAYDPSKPVEVSPPQPRNFEPQRNGY